MEEKISERKAVKGNSLIKKKKNLSLSNRRQFAAFILMEKLVDHVCIKETTQ